MKNLLSLALIILAIGIFSSCEKEEVNSSRIDKNGLTREITDLVPQHILDEMDSLGMMINGGDNPPAVTGTFLATPFVLLASNRPSDYPGMPFQDLQIGFYNQDNNNLTVEVDYQNGPEKGEGLGSFIVGDGSYFTVFVELNVTYNSADKARAVMVFSGKMTLDGIEDFHYANFMINNYGNPSGYFIEEGEGRVGHDTDGFSQKI